MVWREIWWEMHLMKVGQGCEVEGKVEEQVGSCKDGERWKTKPEVVMVVLV